MSGEWLKLISDTPIHSASLVDEMDWKSYVDIWDSNFRWLYGQCATVFDGSLKDAITISADVRQAGGRGVPQKGLFYANLQTPVRPWFMENIVHRPDEHPRTADAGTVTFFA